MPRGDVPAAVRAALPGCGQSRRDGSRCGAPAPYLVWGHLFAAGRRGPRCGRHLPPNNTPILGLLGRPAVLDLPAAAADASAGVPLVCRTFSDDGRQVLCHDPAVVVVWGDGFAKAARGPKCAAHAPTGAGLGVFDLAGFWAGVAEQLPGRHTLATLHPGPVLRHPAHLIPSTL